MKKNYISSDDLRILKLLNTSNCFNSESKILLSPYDEKEIIKIFNLDYLSSDDAEDYLENKFYTINELNDLDHKEELKFCAMPKKLFYVDKEFRGYSMEYFKGMTLGTILERKDITFDKKIVILKKFGQILENIENYRNKYNAKFFLGDIHEDNILVNKNNELKVIDMDSSSINGNEPFSSYYLAPSTKLWDLPEKYEQFLYEFKPSKNTEVYSYICMILSFLLDYNILNLPIDEFNKYLDYLDKLSVNSNLLTCFSKIYEKDDNINPYKLLYTLSSNVDYSYKTYKRTLK